MDLPDALASYVQTMRTAVANMDMTNSHIHLRNVQACISNLRETIKPDAQYERSVLAVVSTANELHDLTANLFDRDRLPSARQKALDAIDGMERALANCKPSDQSIALGRDW